MKKMVLIISLYFAALAGAGANLEVSVTDVKIDGERGALQLKLKNGFDQRIQSARVWVFMFDAEGKVVGNQSQWLFGGEGKKPGLGGDEEASYTIAVQAQKPFSTAKVTFSRIILEDGTMPNPQTSVVEPKKPE